MGFPLIYYVLGKHIRGPHYDPFNHINCIFLSLCVEQRMQQSLKKQQKELQALEEELKTLRQRQEEEQGEQGRHDQEVLALLTQQAERTEESVRQLAMKLQEKVCIQRIRTSQRVRVVSRNAPCNRVVQNA